VLGHTPIPLLFTNKIFYYIANSHSINGLFACCLHGLCNGLFSIKVFFATLVLNRTVKNLITFVYSHNDLRLAIFCLRSQASKLM